MAEKAREIRNESIYEEQLSVALQQKLRAAEITTQTVTAITTGTEAKSTAIIASYYVELGVTLPSAAMRIDGRLPADGDVIVVQSYVLPSTSGLYYYSSTADWERLDAIKPGMLVTVMNGSLYADTLWLVSGQINALSFVDISRYLRTKLEKRTDKLIRGVMRSIRHYVDRLVCRICNIESDVSGVVFSANSLVTNLSLTSGVETYLQFQNIEVSSSYVTHSGGGLLITKPGLYFVDVMVYDENANTSGLIKLRINSPYDSTGPQDEEEVDRFTNTFCDLHGSRICGIKTISDNIIVSLIQSSGATWTLNNPLGGFHHAWVRVFRVGSIGQNVITNSP
jgi:hypothetical protein